MNRPVPVRAHARGFGLVEIMIAMTLGLLLLAGMYEMFLSNKITYNTQQALARLQENTRYVVHTLNHDLRMAGYAGCRPAQAMQISVIAKDLPADGFTSDGFVALFGENDANGNDAVIIRGASGQEARLTDDMNSPKANIRIDSSATHIGEGNLAYISDCVNADIFRVTKRPGNSGLHHEQQGNTSQDLSKSYTRQATVSVFRTTRYYRDESDTATLPDGTPVSSLWRDINGTASELVQGVQDMQIQYGVDSDADPLHSADEYKSSNNVTNWENVVSVRVSLLLQSLTLATDTADTTSTYKLLDRTVGPFDDRYLRRVVTFTVAIRNRVH